MSIFTQVQQKRVPSSTFNLSHDRKQSQRFGYLTPILCVDTLPGDKWEIDCAILGRFAPLVTPVMHQVSMYTHFFFVPNRINWDNFNDFITGGEDGLDTSVAPYIELTDPPIRGLSDYLGIPQFNNPSAAERVSALPYAAYQKIYNEYYRDQNLQTTPLFTTLVDGDNSADATLTVLRQRAWQHDYFTSALPWTQKGPEATIPLGTSANLENDNSGVSIFRRFDASFFPATGHPNLDLNANLTNNFAQVEADDGGGNYKQGNIDVTSHTTVDLSTATAATINDLRQAFTLQQWLEKNARGGSRINESTLVHFGVKTSDGRLQRPEFLGGGATPIQFSEVLQTSGTDSEPTPQGNMAGHGIGTGQNSRIKYFCEDHGYIIGILSVMPRSSYFQGIPRHFLRFDKFDYAWPSFANLGEQEILNKELYVDGTDGENDDVFGYTPRYAEYKFINSTVHGDFRDTLDNWHLARKFASRPSLNSAFIRMQYSEADRIFAVLDGPEDNIYTYVNYRILVNRRLPYFGTPAGI